MIINPAEVFNQIRLDESNTLDIISQVKGVKISDIRNSTISEYIELLILLNKNSTKKDPLDNKKLK